MEIFGALVILALAGIGLNVLISKVVDFCWNYSEFKEWKKRNNK